MNGCKLTQGLGSHVRGDLFFLKNNIHVTNEKLYFAKGLETML